MAAQPTEIEAKPLGSIESQRRYFNRELSWLAFNDRVLEEACNPRHPLLERLRFLSISGNNLDEFFMVRVAGLVGQVAQHVEERSADGRTPVQQLVAIERAVDRLNAEQQRVWSELRTLLADTGVVEANVEDLGETDRAWLREHFVTQIFPVLTPQALDPAHPFPFIPNKGLSLIFDLKRRSDGKTVRELVMLPATMPRFLRIAGGRGLYLALEKIVVAFADKLFPGYDVRGSGLFRIIRDSDIEVEEEAEDLVLYFRTALKRRRRGQVIRLETSRLMDKGLAQLLDDNLLHEGGPSRRMTAFWVSAILPRWSTRIVPTSSFRLTRHVFLSEFENITAIVSQLSEARTSSSTTRMKASRWSSPSSNRPRPTRMWWRSSRRCIAPASSRR